MLVLDRVESGPFARLASTPSSAADVDDRLEVEALLADLDPDQRALVMMTLGLGYTYDEAAEITDVKLGTVASRVSRARDKLRRKGVLR